MGAYNNLLKHYGIDVPYEKSEESDLKTGSTRTDRVKTSAGKASSGIKAEDVLYHKEERTGKKKETETAEKPSSMYKSRKPTIAAVPKRSVDSATSGTYEKPYDTEDKPETVSGKKPERGKKPIPGFFPSSGSKTASGDTSDEKKAEVIGSFSGERSIRPHRERSFPEIHLPDLPPLWGVDLVLILITILGIVLIIENFQMVLFILAKLSFSLLRFLFWIALFAGIVLFAVRALRRR